MNEDLRCCTLQKTSSNWGGRIALRPLNASQHTALLYPLFHGAGVEHVWAYLRDGPFATIADYESHLRGFQSRQDVLACVVEDTISNAPIGMMLVIRLSQSVDAAEIAYVLFAAHVHGTGAARSAVGAMADYVFMELGKTICHWRCDQLNARSAGFAAKMGFRFQAKISNDFVTKGRARDTLIYAQTREHWLEHRQALMEIDNNLT